MVVPDLEIWLSVHWFHGNTELNCIYVGKSMLRELSHPMQSSSYDCFWTFAFPKYSLPPKPHYASCCRCLLFLHCTETKIGSHTYKLSDWWQGKRAKVLCQEQTQKTGLGYVYNLKPLIQTKKHRCRIIISLYSYFHCLILNSVILVSISTGFSVSLFAQLEILPTASVKIQRGRFWMCGNNLLQSSKLHRGTRSEVGPVTPSVLISQLKHRPWHSAVSSWYCKSLSLSYSSWISKTKSQNHANCRIQRLRKIIHKDYREQYPPVK